MEKEDSADRMTREKSFCSTSQHRKTQDHFVSEAMLQALNIYRVCLCWHYCPAKVRFCSRPYFVIPDHCVLVSSTGKDDDGDKNGNYRYRDDNSVIKYLSEKRQLNLVL